MVKNIKMKLKGYLEDSKSLVAFFYFTFLLGPRVGGLGLLVAKISNPMEFLDIQFG